MKKLKPLFFVLLFLLCTQITESIELTKQEENWIKSFKNKEFNIYLNNNLSILNYSFSEEDHGVYYEMINELKKVTDLKFKIITLDNEKLENEIDLGKATIVMGVEDYKRNPSEYIYLSETIDLNATFITKKNHPIIESLDDVKDKTFVYVENDNIIKEFVKHFENNLTTISKSTKEEAVKSLSTNEADIYIEDLQDALKVFMKISKKDIKLNNISPTMKTKYYIGGLHENKILIDILERLFIEMEFNKKLLYEDILNYTKGKVLFFNKIEAFLQNTDEINVFIPSRMNNFPLLYTNLIGRENGFLINYFDELENSLEVKVNFKKSSKMDGFDIYPNIISINDVEINGEDYLTTSPYYEFQFLIFNKENKKYFPNLESIGNHKIAVRKGSLEEIYILDKGLEENIITFDSQKEVINAVLNETADMFIGEIKNIHYLLKKYKIKDIKETGIIKDKISLMFGVPKENETLYLILTTFLKEYSSSTKFNKQSILERELILTKDLKILLFLTFIYSIIGLGLIVHIRNHRKLNVRLKDLTHGLVISFENANSYNDEDTGEHIKRVCEYSHVVASELKISRSIVKEIELYASLHDIGKIGISDSILKKPGKLTNDEFDEMKKHVEIGYNLIKGLGVSNVALNIVRYHHEKWNGKGYGVGLSGENIPLEARIVALSDVYDALRQKRVYKKAFSHEAAFGIIQSESGEHFDPEIVKVFIKNHKKFEDIFDNHSTRNKS